MKAKIKALFLFAFFFTLIACFPQEPRIKFNPETKLLSSCNSLGIKRVLFYWKKAGMSEFEFLTEYNFINGSKESDNLIIGGRNNHYLSSFGEFEMEPNTIYKLEIPHLDTRAFIYFYTDKLAKIVNVENEFDCKIGSN